MDKLDEILEIVREIKSAVVTVRDIGEAVHPGYVFAMPSFYEYGTFSEPDENGAVHIRVMDDYLVRYGVTHGDEIDREWARGFWRKAIYAPAIKLDSVKDTWKQTVIAWNLGQSFAPLGMTGGWRTRCIQSTIPVRDLGLGPWKEGSPMDGVCTFFSAVDTPSEVEFVLEAMRQDFRSKHGQGLGFT